MSLVPSAGLLVLALLTSPPEGRLSALEECEAASPSVALTAESASTSPVVCVSRKLTTTLLFDTKLATVEVKERERFRRVVPGEDALLLQPPDTLQPGEVLPVSVCFADGAAPACVTFRLVAHPALGMQQVEVSRQPSSLAHYQERAERAEARVQHLETQAQQCLAGHDAPDGIRGALVSGLLGKNGIAARNLIQFFREDAGNALTPGEAHTYRANGRVAVEVQLLNLGTTPWQPVGAVLRGLKGEVLKPLPLWPSAPILPEGQGAVRKTVSSVVVEVLASESEARGSYTLTLWDETRRRTVTLSNVTFP